ncbi:hypothetical protein KQI63_08835 [bacterium]|nr:hypothetical protein [bacterium]
MRNVESEKRSPVVVALLVLLGFQALSGIGGGVYLVADPSGAAIGFPEGMLDGAVFKDYLIPGLILLLVLGVFPTVVTLAVWRRQAWAWFGSGATGIALVIWILVEILIVGYMPDPPLQAIYGPVGALILLLTLHRSTRMYLGQRAEG